MNIVKLTHELVKHKNTSVSCPVFKDDRGCLVCNKMVCFIMMYVAHAVYLTNQQRKLLVCVCVCVVTSIAFCMIRVVAVAVAESSLICGLVKSLQ